MGSVCACYLASWCNKVSAACTANIAKSFAGSFSLFIINSLNKCVAMYSRLVNPVANICTVAWCGFNGLGTTNGCSGNAERCGLGGGPCGCGLKPGGLGSKSIGIVSSGVNGVGVANYSVGNCSFRYCNEYTYSPGLCFVSRSLSK